MRTGFVGTPIQYRPSVQATAVQRVAQALPAPRFPSLRVKRLRVRIVLALHEDAHVDPAAKHLSLLLFFQQTSVFLGSLNPNVSVVGKALL